MSIAGTVALVAAGLVIVSHPFGPVLVVIAGLGIITYGLYDFAMAGTPKCDHHRARERGRTSPTA